MNGIARQGISILAMGMTLALLSCAPGNGVPGTPSRSSEAEYHGAEVDGISSAVLRGRVVDPVSDAPVRSATASIIRGWGEREDVKASVVSGQDGRFQLTWEQPWVGVEVLQGEPGAPWVAHWYAPFTLKVEKVGYLAYERIFRDVPHVPDATMVEADTIELRKLSLPPSWGNPPVWRMETTNAEAKPGAGGTTEE